DALAGQRGWQRTRTVDFTAADGLYGPMVAGRPAAAGHGQAAGNAIQDLQRFERRWRPASGAGRESEPGRSGLGPGGERDRVWPAAELRGRGDGAQRYPHSGSGDPEGVGAARVDRDVQPQVVAGWAVYRGDDAGPTPADGVRPPVGNLVDAGRRSDPQSGVVAGREKRVLPGAA